MKRNSKLLVALVGVVVVMLVFAVLNIPLFKMFCSAVGIDLSPNRDDTEAQDSTFVDESRPLKVLFTTTVNDDLPIVFESQKKSENIYVGEQDKNIYYFANLTDDTLYFRPVHSVFPAGASKKYTMLECFCFRDMTLLPKEEKEVPLVYYFNNDLSEDITRVTMHYTLFERDKDEIDTTAVPKFGE